LLSYNHLKVCIHYVLHLNVVTDRC